ncbi:hypothetical protein Hypma_012493 [Hypsizygus marmoreus]|uniref:Uncharacterized protein n=1 Tax=Hypsizygus marmoreus TaxID=39966 RepID=A0A369JEV0_HYPMA|nr:hypothetical protein Hypma_012493 [Hypsizygus marmoreus]
MSSLPPRLTAVSPLSPLSTPHPPPIPRQLQPFPANCNLPLHAASRAFAPNLKMWTILLRWSSRITTGLEHLIGLKRRDTANDSFKIPHPSAPQDKHRAVISGHPPTARPIQASSKWRIQQTTSALRARSPRIYLRRRHFPVSTNATMGETRLRDIRREREVGGSSVTKAARSAGERNKETCQDRSSRRSASSTDFGRSSLLTSLFARIDGFSGHCEKSTSQTHADVAASLKRYTLSIHTTPPGQHATSLAETADNEGVMSKQNLFNIYIRRTCSAQDYNVLTPQGANYSTVPAPIQERGRERTLPRFRTAMKAKYWTKRDSLADEQIVDERESEARRGNMDTMAVLHIAPHGRHIRPARKDCRLSGTGMLNTRNGL